MPHHARRDAPSRATAGASGDASPEAFARRVYRIVHHIPTGRVLTYGDVAALAGSARAARAVGSLMKASLHRAPDLPWHRVINARGTISIRGDFERPRRQYERLRAEGVTFDADGRCDLPALRWPLDEALASLGGDSGIAERDVDPRGDASHPHEDDIRTSG